MICQKKKMIIGSKRIFGCKGILQILEAAIAIIAILTVFLFLFSGMGEFPQFESVNWKLKGFYALQSLDNNNELRNFVISNDTTSIKNELLSYVTQVNIEVVVCETVCNKPDVESEKLVSVNYLIAGNSTQYAARQVVIYMW